MDTTPCELHEIWPCATCTGVEKRFQATLGSEDSDLEPGTRLTPGVIASHYPGRCARCGLDYGIGSPIRFSGDGWVATGCCG